MKKLGYEVIQVLKEKKVLMCLIIASALIAGFLLGYFREKSPKETSAEPTGAANLVVDTSATDEEATTAEAALKDRNVYFAGLDNMTVDKDTVIRLENLKENEDILISYSIVDTGTGQELFKTDLIPSGMHVDWKPSEYLDEGVYELSYNQNPVWMAKEGEYISLTCANNVATLTLTE